MKFADEVGFRKHILLSLRRGLLAGVSPALRGVTVGWSWEELSVLIRCLYDGPISDEDRELMFEADAVVFSALGGDVAVEFSVERYDFPAPLMDRTLKEWVYRRRENF
ncbi:MAG: hypothetical protein V2B18_17785 [Pseudomonadota bacterium]